MITRNPHEVREKEKRHGPDEPYLIWAVFIGQEVDEMLAFPRPFSNVSGGGVNGDVCQPAQTCSFLGCSKTRG
jgi:hypothetical protein